jgi:hypothetical protein
MKGTDVLAALAIPVPGVAVTGGSCAPLQKLLTGNTVALATATREALDGGPIDPLLAQIDRAALWPAMASGVRIAAEVAGHLSAARRHPIPRRQSQP